MSKRNFTYAHGSIVRTGVMVCAACRKPIGHEQYRYYSTHAGFVNHHRACCAGDPNWLTLDDQETARSEHAKRLTEAARDFYAKWGVTDLSEYLEPAHV